MTNISLEITVSDYQKVLSKIQEHIARSYQNIAQLISRQKVELAFNVGKVIDDYFLSYDEKTYGAKLIDSLANDVGISQANLYKMRHFYRTYPDILEQKEHLNWTHYRILIGIKEEEQRRYFEDRVKEYGLNSRQLQEEVKQTKTPNTPKSQVVKTVIAPNRGQLFTYEVTQIKGKDGYFLDLGFGVLKEVDEAFPDSLKKEGCVVKSSWNSNKDGFEFAVSTTPHNERHTYVALLDRVVDGDTIRVSLDLGFGIFEKQILRLAKINTPELSTKAGQKAITMLKELLGDCEYVVIKTLKTDMYGRYVADVFLPFEFLGQGVKDGKTQAVLSAQETAVKGFYLNQEIVRLGLGEVY